MLFYKVTGIMEANEAPEEDRRVRRENQRKIEMKSEEFNRNHSSNSFYFISEIDNTVVTAGVIADNKNKVESDLAEFFKYLDLTLKDVSINDLGLLVYNASMPNKRDAFLWWAIQCIKVTPYTNILITEFLIILDTTLFVWFYFWKMPENA